MMIFAFLDSFEGLREPFDGQHGHQFANLNSPGPAPSSTRPAFARKRPSEAVSRVGPPFGARKAEKGS